MNELIEALKLIQNTCNESELCKECPFGRECDCLLTSNNPGEWDIQDAPVSKVMF